MDRVDISLQNIVKEVNTLEEFEKERTVFQVCAVLIWYVWYLVLLGCYRLSHDGWGHKLLVAAHGCNSQIAVCNGGKNMGGIASCFDPHKTMFQM
jgi:hypothetical protein